jgi:hypothetical protein
LAVSRSQRRHGAGPIVLAGAVPLLFLHRHYQPSFSLGSADVDLSDAAVAAVCVAALLTRAPVPRRAYAGLRAVAALALVVFLWTAWGAHAAGYSTGTHLITAGKWFEYMLLAPAVVLIVRRAEDVVPATVVLITWSLVATSVGLLQFFGVIDDLDHTPAGRRKPSLLGYHDFSALSAAALVVALLIVAARLGHRRAALVAGVSGAIGMILGGAFDAVLGELLATIAIVAAYRVHDVRRLALIAGALLSVVVGTVAIRSQAVSDGLKFLGVKQGTGGASVNVQSYRQRALLAYIGGRIFLDHPLVGVGFEGSTDEFAYGPYVADAKRKFDQPPEAFPSPAHPWGVQNAYVQSLADFGVLGLVLFLASTLAIALGALRRGIRPLAVAGAGLVLVALGAWNGFGLIAGIPLDALTWLAVGICLTALRQPEPRAR